MYRARLNRILILITCCTIFIFSIILIKISKVPNNIMLLEGEQHLFDVKLPIKVSINLRRNDVLKLSGNTLNSENFQLNLLSPFKIESFKDGKADIDIKLLGFIPLKHVTVNVLPQIKVIPGGQPVGVKLTTKGVMVVGVSQVDSIDGKQYNPSLNAGIEIGDTIVKIDNTIVRDGEHVAKLINMSNGNPVKLYIIRKSKEMEITIQPIKSKEDQQYKIGIWIRDSTAGVGTLTFYCPSTNTYGALGHPITDVDTGVILSVSSGKIVPSKIISIQPGMRGKPGELRGLFIDNEEEIGNITKNTLCGIYGSEIQ